MRHKGLLALALIPLTVVAAPSPSVRYLMERPVSALEFGLMRLEGQLSDNQQDTLNAQSFSVMAEYNWDADRIQVSILVGLTPDAARSKLAKSTCRRVLQTSRVLLGVDAEKGTLLEGVSNAAAFFQPSGFSIKSQPADLATDVLSIIELKVSIYGLVGQGGSSLSSLARCEGRLLSKDVLFPG